MHLPQILLAHVTQADDMKALQLKKNTRSKQLGRTKPASPKIGLTLMISMIMLQIFIYLL